MPFDNVHAAEADIDLIVVTDDRAHAQSLLGDLSGGRYRYSLIQIGQRVTLLSDFDTAVAAVRGRRPVIVFLDCEFLNGQTELLAARILGLQRDIAIECVAIRPPREPHRRAYLRLLGASLFDDCAQATAIRLPH